MKVIFPVFRSWRFRDLYIFRIYKDVRPTGNSWTVFLQATSAQPLTRQIHRRNARQIRPLNLCRDARQIRHLSQFPHPSESQGLPSETQGS